MGPTVNFSVMLRLLRLDPLVHALSRWLAVFLFGSSGFIVFAVTASQGDSPVSWRLLMASLWAVIAFFFVLAPAYDMPNRLSLSLPLDARTLWLVRIAGRFAGASFLLAGATLISVAFVASVPQVEASTATIWEMAGRLGAAGFAGLSLWAFRAPLVVQGPLWRAATADLFVAVGILVLATLLAGLPAAVSLAPIAVGLALLLGRYRGLAGAPTLAPANSKGKMPVASAGSLPYVPGHTGGLAWRWLLLRTMVGQLYRHPIFYFLLLAADGLFGFLLAGTPTDWPEGGEARFDQVIMAAYMMFSLSSVPVAGLVRVDHLPISRRLLAACVFAPMLLALSLGYAVGEWGVSRLPNPELVKIRPSAGHLEIFVPLSAQRVAWAGDLPESRSPAGEAHPPWSVALWTGTDALFYNPYYIPPEASAEFAAWQISRALEAVYGARIPPAEIKGRYLETKADGTLALKGGDFRPRGDYSDLTPLDSGPVFPVVFLLSGLLYLVSLGAVLHAYRSKLRRRLQRFVFWIPMAMLMGVFVLYNGVQIAGWTEGWALNGACLILIAELGRMPGGFVAAWVLGPAAVLAAYRLVESIFAKTECGLLQIAGETGCR